MTEVSIKLSSGNSSLSPGYNISHGYVTLENQTSGYVGDLYEAYQNPFHILHIKITFIVLYSLVFACCFFGNLLVIVVILRHRKMRTVTNFFLGNLAVADFCVGIFCVIPNLLHNIRLEWILGRVLCKLSFFVQSMSYTASVIILTIISAERYLAIIYPIRSKQITSLCLLRGIIIAVWLTAGMCGMPYLILYDTVLIGNTSYCVPFNSVLHFNQKVHSVVNIILGYIIPLILMSCMYTRISLVLWNTSRGNNLGVTTAGKLKAKKNPLITIKSEEETQSPRKGILRNGKAKFRGLDAGTVDEAEELNPRNGNQTVVGVNWCSKPKRSSSSPVKTTLPQEGMTTPEDYEDDWPKKHKKSKSMEMGRIASECVSSGGNSSISSQKPAAIRGSLVTDKRPENALIARRKVIRLLVSVIVSFAICVLPYHIRMFWMFYATDIEMPLQLFQPIAFLCYYMNSGLNPLLYAFLSENFRRSLVEVVTCSERRHKYQTMKSNTYGSKTTHYTVNSTVNY